MATEGIEVLGLAELQATLDQIKTTQAKRILNRGLQAAGGVFKAEIEARAPERPDLPSGTALPVGAMQHDIEVHTRRAPVGAALVSVGPGKYTTHAARWVEFGHRLIVGGYSKLLASGRTKGPGRHVGQVPAYPFLRPSYEAAYNPALAAFKASVQRDVGSIKQLKGSD